MTSLALRMIAPLRGGNDCGCAAMMGRLGV